MLLNILNFIQQEKMVSNQQIARAFKIESQALQPLLEVWLRKGKIKAYQQPICKKSCFKCRPVLTYYCYQAS